MEPSTSKHPTRKPIKRKAQGQHSAVGVSHSEKLARLETNHSKSMKKESLKLASSPLVLKKAAAASTPQATCNKQNKLTKSWSAPNIKHKKLQQELQEELSDEEFDTVLKHVAVREKHRSRGKTKLQEVASDDSETSGDSENGEENSDSSENDEENDQSSKYSDNMHNDDADESQSDDEHSEDVEGNERAHLSDKRQNSKRDLSSASRQRLKMLISRDQYEVDKARREDVKRRQVFIKQLPTLTEEKHVRKLMSEKIRNKILDIQIGVALKKNKYDHRGYATVTFTDSLTVPQALTDLQHTKVNKVPVIVDSCMTASTTTPDMFDPLRLYVGNLPKMDAAKVERVKTLFPTADRVQLLTRKRDNSSLGFCFVHYSDQEQCRKAHEASQNLHFMGKKLIVLYAKKTGNSTKSKVKIQDIDGDNDCDSKKDDTDTENNDTDSEDKDTESEENDTDSEENDTNSEENSTDSEENGTDREENGTDSED